MSPEEHLRRMRDDEVWNLAAPPRTSRSAGAVRTDPPRGRTQIWATAVVAALVVAGAGVAVGLAPDRGSGPAGPGGAGATASPEPTPSARASERATASASPVPSAPTPAPSKLVRSSGGVPLQIRAEPSAGPVPAASHGDRPALEFVAADRADVARGRRAIACLHAEGVRFVDLAAPDAEGIRYLAFGGADNDRRSISLGLQHVDGCIAAAGR